MSLVGIAPTASAFAGLRSESAELQGLGHILSARRRELEEADDGSCTRETTLGKSYVAATSRPRLIDYQQPLIDIVDNQWLRLYRRR